MTTQISSIDLLEVVRKGNFSIVDGKIVLTTSVSHWNTTLQDIKFLYNEHFEFDLNGSYDEAVKQFEEIIHDRYTFDHLTFDENIFDGDVIDDQMVESFITFATGLNQLVR